MGQKWNKKKYRKKNYKQAKSQGTDQVQQNGDGAVQPQDASLLQGPNVSRAEKRNGVPFWGDDALLPQLSDEINVTDDPDAVPRSLGNPPLPGKEQIAAQFFKAVHMRAVQFGAALAATSALAKNE